MRLWRVADRETVSVEAYSGLDAQGKPSYNTEVEIEAHVRRSDSFVITSDGSEVKTPVTLYVEGDEAYLPDERDRVTVDSETFIAMERKTRRRIITGRSTLDHIRLRCREGS